MENESVSLNDDLKNNRKKALEVLQKCKEYEKNKKYLTVWVDRNTQKLMTLEKIKKKGLELFKVKIGGGRLAWMERKTAIKNGFIR